MAELDVLLIKPDFLDIAVLPPLGLGYLAARLREEEISVAIHDNTLLEYDDTRLGALIKELRPKVVGMGIVTPMLKRAEEIARLTKAIDKDILVVFGGPHPTATVDETLAIAEVDVVVSNEGEDTLPELVERFLKGSKDFTNIDGLAFKDEEGSIIKNRPRPMEKALDRLPFPAFDLMPIEEYFSGGKGFGILQKGGKSLPLIASRGCPSECTFCQRFLGHRFRVRSAENIVAEIEERMERYGVTEFNFLDDNFTLHKQRVIEVCNLIHEKGLKINFRFPNGVREDFLDKEILDSLKSVGCYHLDIGIESGSQKVLDLMKKGKKLDEIAEKVRLCKRLGFKVSSSFLFGTPGETIADMEETIRFAKSLPLDSASFGTLIPFPGTELREIAIETNSLVHSDYEYYNIGLASTRPPIETEEWSGQDLLAMVKRANRAFFFSPKRVIKLLPTIFNPKNFKRYASMLSQVIRG